MKNLSIILVAGITVPILLLVSANILWPTKTPLLPAIIVSIDDEIAPIKATLTQQEAAIQAELDELNRSLQQKQAEFETQTLGWQIEMNQAQHRLTILQATAQAQQNEIATLEITHTLQLNAYQTQLEQTRQHYQIDQLQSQLREKQAELDQIKGSFKNNFGDADSQ